MGWKPGLFTACQSSVAVGVSGGIVCLGDKCSWWRCVKQRLAQIDAKAEPPCTDQDIDWISAAGNGTEGRRRD